MAESALTVDTLVDELLDVMHGYSRNQDVVTSLAAPMGAADLTFTVADASRVSRGVVEIEDELVQVSTVDMTTGVVSVHPWGRGNGDTAATTHDAGAKITVAPLYTRQRVRNAIFGVVREIFPDVFAVSQYQIDGSAVQVNYTMPADCWSVLGVETKALGGSLMWSPVSRWRQHKHNSGVEVEILGPVYMGTNSVRINYVRTPPTTIADTDDLSTYGYDNQIRDLIVLGASAKLMAFTEPARVQQQTMEAHGRNESVPAGSATATARMLYQMFRQRVEQERAQALTRYPAQMHMTR